jgi:hypothetical protein
MGVTGACPEQGERPRSEEDGHEGRSAGHTRTSRVEVGLRARTRCRGDRRGREPDRVANDEGSDGHVRTHARGRPQRRARKVGSVSRQHRSQWATSCRGRASSYRLEEVITGKPVASLRVGGLGRPFGRAKSSSRSQSLRVRVRWTWRLAVTVGRDE